MNQKKRELSRRELLDRLYETADGDYDDDSFDDAPYYDDEVRRHPEAPLNDSIELEKRTKQRGRSARAERAREEDLEFAEFLAEKRARQRRDRRLNNSGEQDSFSKANKQNSSNRHWSSCRPVFVGCALTCLLTAGLVKGQEIIPFFSGLFNPNQQQSQQVNPLVQVTQPIPTTNNRWLTSTPMVTDRTNSMERVAGLSASKSTITGFADSDSMTAAYYWTLLVSNSGQTNQEARMRIALPPGVTLSRATLWVNGVPQEAAFSTTEQVTAAYTWVRDGREQQRFLSADPLLITQESPGHLLVKAAPIVAGGQPLQLRLGFTAPLTPSSSQAASMRLPQIQESNFEVNGAQDVHLQSSTSIWSNESEVTAIPDQGGFLLRGNVQEDRLTSLRINVARAGSEQFATRATHSPRGTFIVASMKPDSNGRTSLSLLKTKVRPSCRIINSEPAAVRLSTLWAYGQVEANVRRGNRFNANELARIFRVVSSVSGAAVLEQDLDYVRQGLSRDQFATYGANAGASAGAGGSGEAFDSFASVKAAQRSLPRTRSMEDRITPSPVAPSMAPSFAAPKAPSPSPSPSRFASTKVKSQLVGTDGRVQDLDKKSRPGSDADSEEVMISDPESVSSPMSSPMTEAASNLAEDSTAPAQNQQQFPALLLPTAIIAGLLLILSRLAVTRKLFAKLKK